VLPEPRVTVDPRAEPEPPRGLSDRPPVLTGEGVPVCVDAVGQLPLEPCYRHGQAAGHAADPPMRRYLGHDSLPFFSRPRPASRFSLWWLAPVPPR
jgi:hypothetical protein